MATAKKAPAKKAPAKKAPATKAAINKTAAPQTARGRAQDRRLVAGTQAYEVSYVAKHTGTTIAQVKAALRAAGHSRVKVVKALTGK